MKHFFILCLLLCVVSGYSQSDFREGFILNKEYDTLYGFVDYRGDILNSKKCTFILKQSNEKTDFSPDEIQAYGYKNSKYYISRTILSGTDSISVFLEYLIDGIVDVFYFKDNNGEHYFIENENNDFLELKNELVEKVVNGSSFLQESKEYVGALKYSFRDAPEVYSKADYVQLNHKSLINIAEDYHKAICNGEECIIYERKTDKRPVLFGPVISFQTQNLIISEQFLEPIEFLNGANFERVSYPTIGFFVKRNSEQFNERLFFIYEANLSKNTVKTKKIYTDQVYYYNHVESMHFNHLTIQNNLFVRYEFPQGKVRPAFSLGSYFNYFINREYIFYQTTTYTSHTNTTEENYNQFFGKYDFGLLAGTGLNYELNENKKLLLDLRYYAGTNFGFAKSLRANVFSINIGLKFQSKK